MKTKTKTKKKTKAKDSVDWKKPICTRDGKKAQLQRVLQMEKRTVYVVTFPGSNCTLGLCYPKNGRLSPHYPIAEDIINEGNRPWWPHLDDVPREHLQAFIDGAE